MNRAAAAASLFEATRDELATASFPLSTYRLQFHRGFTFEDARKRLPYLEKLGVTDVYASPYLAATPGSQHGYDVIDHSRVNPEVGSEVEHAAFCEAVRRAGMGQLFDFVPNHMGIERLNPAWRDVLENGPSSRFAKFFDIDWAPVKDELEGKVLLPILGEQYGVVLEKGELTLCYADGEFLLRYFDHDFPIAPRQYRFILRHQLASLVERLGEANPVVIELQSILTALAHLPRRTETEPLRVSERAREKEVIKRRLRALVEGSAEVLAFIEKNVSDFNGTPGDARSFDRLDQVLSGCSYRLAHWRVAGEEINYRRFFDINSLAAIRVEDPEVFAAAHDRVFEWLAEGKLTGLRIDHPDGLFDPTAYFLDLQERYFLDRARKWFEAAGESYGFAELAPLLRQRWRAEVGADEHSPLRRALYVVVEKIQGGKERIPESWAMHGTTGYRFANSVGGVLVDRSSEQALTQTYERFIGRAVDYRQLVYEKKKLVMGASMASEINVLARELNRVSEMNRRTRDFTLGSLRRALVEFIALFPVYRTYVDDWRPEVDARDVQYIEWTIARAKQKDPTTNVSIFDFLKEILLRRYPGHLAPEEKQVMLRFAMKLQQLTGPVMAKGLEDTVFYLYNRLVSLNEVGAEPERFGTAIETFHLRNQERAQTLPHSLVATSTHDTKRSEDVRARLHVLSEVPDAWRERVEAWATLNADLKTRVDDAQAPEPNDEYLFYQTVVGTLPMGEGLAEAERAVYRARIGDYMQKAIREGKANTSWVNPVVPYEEATARFVERALQGPFLDEALKFKRRIERAGQLNSLSQTLLKVASPGTADLYQGCELWDLSLVDPDNRRPVDFARRFELLEALERAQAVGREPLCRELTAHLDDGRAKLYLLTEGLKLRRRLAPLFHRGSYLPLDLGGPRAAHAIAFARTLDAQPSGPGEALLAVAPRLTWSLLERPGGLAGGLAGSVVVVPEALAPASFTCVFTGRVHRATLGEHGWGLDLGELLQLFPVALLHS